MWSFVDEKDERQRVKKYSTFIESLPKINRSTLDALLQHLYRYTHKHTHTLLKLQHMYLGGHFKVSFAVRRNCILYSITNLRYVST